MLNRRHARAGRSPRASEGGAPAEHRSPVDRASARDTLAPPDGLRVVVAGPDGFEADGRRGRVRRGVGVDLEIVALCHYPRLLQDVSGIKLPVEAGRGMGVVTEGKSGLQASGGKGSTKDFCSVAFVTRC